MGNSSFNGLFASPGKVVLLEDEGIRPPVTLPSDQHCLNCGDAKTVLELVDGVCFDPCRYGKYLKQREAK